LPNNSHLNLAVDLSHHTPLLYIQSPTMSVATLSKSLPRPKYTGEEEELTHSTRVLTADQYETQIARRQNGPPAYGSRNNWRPRAAEDFGDGGAFPEVHVAQYPLDMGKKGTASSSNALVRRVDGEGKTQYDEIARRGHGESRIVQASFKDLIPLRQRADAGELDLAKPSQEVVQATKLKTEQAIMALVSGQTAAQRPKNVQGRKNDEPTFVRYTPTAQMGEAQGKTRIFKIQQRQIDPLEPPKFKHKRIPRGPPSVSLTVCIAFDTADCPSLRRQSCTRPLESSRQRTRRCGRFLRPSATGRIPRVTLCR
jgi:SNW domain-containing protein 1